jgi:hypothetical protein
MTISAPATPATLAALPTTLLQRIRGEFLEMPGLHLTLRQAARLWHLEPETCDLALRALIADGFLRQTTRGSFQIMTGADR